MILDDNLNKYQWIFAKLGMWRTVLGFLMGKFCRFLTELPARDMPVFSFPDDNVGKYQWILVKLGMCTDIVDI